MKYYLDITLLPDPEITLGFIWCKVYQQVHIALADNKIAKNSSAIALSFPDYGRKEFPLGNKLRIFSPTHELLEKLAINTWLKRFADYIHITSIKTVPDTIHKYVNFSRKQFNSNVYKLARRRAKRHEETFEQALLHYASFKDKKTELPFINVKSLTEDKQFRLFIRCLDYKAPQQGEFNCYGLSKNIATVPWF